MSLEMDSKSGTGQVDRASLELDRWIERVWNWKSGSSKSGTEHVDQASLSGSSESGTGQVDQERLELDRWIE